MQPILITGGTGFVGRWVVRAHLASGRPIRALVRRSSKIPIEWQEQRQLETVVYNEGSSTSALANAFNGVTRVVHLAGLAHSAGTESLFFQSNAEFTAKLCTQARKVGVTHFIHLSSLATSTPNTTPNVIDGRSDFEPENAYGRSKKCAEFYVQEILGKSALAVSLRPPLVIGAEAPGNWALLQRLAATRLWLPFASVQAPRNFVSLETLIGAILHLLSSKLGTEASGNYIISDRQAVKLSQVVPWLRVGMKRPPRIFAFPPALLMAGGQFLGRGRQFAGLLGPLEVNDEHFRTTFGFTHQSDMKQSIEQSGRDYVAARSHQ
jgi:nucleoside-diphosphate-sugar epimerase